MTEKPPGLTPPGVPWGTLLLFLGFVLALLLQPQEFPGHKLAPGALFPRRALVGEDVWLGLGNLPPQGVRVLVDGVPAEVLEVRQGSLRFRVPQVPGGPRGVRVEAMAGVLEATLGVLGRVVPNEALLFLPPGKTPALSPAFRLLEAVNLDACGLRLVRVGIGSLPLGLALEELATLDPEYKADPESLWSLDSGLPEALGAQLFWAKGAQGQGVTVAILDTGVDPHPVLEGRVLAGYDFVDEDPIPQDAFPGGHGTGVAGLVLAVAPEARILPLRVCDERGVCRASRVIRGICRALQAPRPLVLNLSLGGDTPVEALEVVLEEAISQGVPVAAAAGNQGPGGPAHYPAAYDLPGLLAVAALASTGEPAPFSTRGGYVDLAAPGEALPCPSPGGGTDACRGTSFAAPLVAGALALLLQAYPGLDPPAYARLLQEGAMPLPWPLEAVGSGRLDLSRIP